MDRKKVLSRATLIAMTLLVSKPLLAEKHWLVSLAFDFGGDQVSNVRLENNDSERIKANEGFSIAAGIRKSLGPNSELYTTLGWKTGGVFGSNGQVSWSALPVEGTYFVSINRVLVVGGGASYFLNPKLNVEDIGNQFARATDYDNALGFHVKLAYQPENMSYRFGAKFTSVEFDSENNDEAIDGSSIGFFSEFIF